MMQIGQEVTTIDGKRGKVQHIEQFCAGGKVREFCWVRIPGNLDVSDWGKELPQYLASQLTPVEPWPKCSNCGYRHNPALPPPEMCRGKENPMAQGKPCGHHYAICTHCDLCPMNPHPETYAQRLGILEDWITKSWREWGGAKPAELMICERHKECKRAKCPYGRREPHVYREACPVVYEAEDDCHVKCIPYVEPKEWFVVAKDTGLWVNHPHTLMTKADALKLIESIGANNACAFRWSQGVK